MSGFNRFLEIRRQYAQILPEWMAEYEKTGDMRQDPYFMNWEFTPIEHNVWSDIRSLGLPFFPQVPVLNYFIDFGNPFLKIGIECDGKAWHDSDLDRARDARLAAAGWMIFRIEGHECVRVVNVACDDEEPHPGDLEKFYLATSEGVLTAIKRKYFEPARDLEHSYLIESTLFNHRSTREFARAAREVESSGPVLIGDMLDEYVALLERRMQREVA